MDAAESGPAYEVLADPLRRRAYLHVRSLHRPVSREEVAAELGISHNLAAFHLDKLLDAGLLSAHYARPEGRGGRGAGRPAKWYRATEREIRVQIPARRYDLAGELLARAVADADHDQVVSARAGELARENGWRLGRDYRTQTRLRRVGPDRSLRAAADVLGEAGYEPYLDPDGLVLGNCPFHAITEAARDVVCGFNVELVRGVLDGLRADGVMATLDPAEGRCCVVVRPV